MALGFVVLLFLLLGAGHYAKEVDSAWRSVDRVELGVRAEEATATSPARVMPSPTDGAPPTDSAQTEHVEDLPTTTLRSGVVHTLTPSEHRPPTTSAPETAPSGPSPTTTEAPTKQLSADSVEPPEVFALVGIDSRAGLTDHSDFGEFPGQHADVIVLAIRNTKEVMMLSIPRDLYVEDLCRGGNHRISSAMAGCGDRSGLGQLVVELEHVTGLSIDHAAAVDLAGFQKVVDTLGGYEICSEYALRDSKSGLQLEAGCTMADGATTLQWLRSRYTERYRNGAWETVPNVSDLTRNERQRRFLVDLLEEQTDVNNPSRIVKTARAVAPYLTIDDQLSLRQVASWIWDLRQSDVVTEQIPVRGETTRSGAEVLLPTVNIESFIEDIES